MLTAICLQVFDQAAALGFSMTVLDLGGGYPGGQWDSQGRFNLAPVAAAINQGLAKFFPVTCGVTVIAEPGRCVFQSLLRGCRSTSADCIWCTEPGAGQILPCGTWGHRDCRAWQVCLTLFPALHGSRLQMLSR